MSVTGEIKNLYSDKDKTRVLLPRTKTKAVSDENGTSLDVLLDGKAPAGYGLGAHSIYTADCHAIDTNGWYYTDPSTINMPPSGFAYSSILAKTRGGNLVLEITETPSGLKAQCYKNGSSWSEWEYVNPPMELGVEYRTTERWLGMPVYCKAVNVEAFPTNGSSASVYYLDYSPRAVLRFVAHSSYILYPSRVYGKHIDVMDNKIYMESTDTPYDGGSVHVAVWYVKN